MEVTSLHLSRHALLRSRLRAHAVVLLVLWPLATTASATIDAWTLVARYIPLPWAQALAGAAGGVALLLPDFLLVGTGLLCSSLLLFTWLGRRSVDRPVSFRRLCLEPVAMLGAILCGACAWYPALLGHTSFLVFWELPSVLVLTLLVFVDVHFIYDVVPRGRRLKLALALGTLGLLAPVTSVMVTAVRGSDRPSELVLLGLDSVAQTDDVGSLREFVATRGGAWYQRAVAPGLLTNAVWASVMTMKPVREHGVFQTFQPFPRNQAKLLQSARAAGFYTVSVFSDQITCAIGSQAGFDEDRSGPIGWRQMMLTAVQNSSVFLPLFRPILSGAPWSAAPVNHAGTYTYDLTREVREILTSGVPGRKTFVAAHLTYLHLAAYPRAFDLSGHELWRMAQARAGSLRDRSFYWQDSDLPTDPVPLHRWKLARLQRVIRETVESTGFLEGGRLLIFSDHGERTGLTPETIGDPRFHHVLLASFGLPVANVDQPRSLADIGSLLGLSPPQASDPVVEFINPPPELWPSLTASARPRWSGQVDVDPVLLGLVFKSLKSHRPWASHSKGEAPTGESHDARPHE